MTLILDQIIQRNEMDINRKATKESDILCALTFKIQIQFKIQFKL